MGPCLEDIFLSLVDGGPQDDNNFISDYKDTLRIFCYIWATTLAIRQCHNIYNSFMNESHYKCPIPRLAEWALQIFKLIVKRLKDGTLRIKNV